MRKISKKARAEFLKKGVALLQSLGATPAPDAYREGMFMLETRYGKLRITLCLGETMLWVATQFDEPQRAIGNVCGASLNPYSGKWNFNTEDLDHVKSHLLRVLPEDVCNKLAQPDLALA